MGLGGFQTTHGARAVERGALQRAAARASPEVTKMRNLTAHSVRVPSERVRDVPTERSGLS